MTCCTHHDRVFALDVLALDSSNQSPMFDTAFLPITKRPSMLRTGPPAPATAPRRMRKAMPISILARHGIIVNECDNLSVRSIKAEIPSAEIPSSLVCSTSLAFPWSERRPSSSLVPSIDGHPPRLSLRGWGLGPKGGQTALQPRDPVVGANNDADSLGSMCGPPILSYRISMGKTFVHGDAGNRPATGIIISTSERIIHALRRIRFDTRVFSLYNALGFEPQVRKEICAAKSCDLGDIPHSFRLRHEMTVTATGRMEARISTISRRK